MSIDVQKAKTVIEISVETKDAERAINKLADTEKKASEARDKYTKSFGDSINGLAEQFGSVQSVAASMGKEIVGRISAIVAPAAIAAGAIGKITDALADVAKRDEDLRSATGSMLRYAFSVGAAREAVEHLQSTSKLLQADIKETTASFLAVADATGDLGLSEKQLTDITRTLGMVMKIEDRSIGDSTKVLETLQFAMEKGTLAKGELVSLFKAFPPIAAIWEKSLGKSQEQLIKMAAAGQLGRDAITQMLLALGDGSGVNDKYVKKLEATTDGSLKNQLALASQKMELERVKESTSGVSEESEKLKAAFLALAHDPWADTRSSMGQGLDMLTEKTELLWGALQKLARDPWGNTVDGFSATGGFISEGLGKIGLAIEAGKKYSDKYIQNAKKARAERDRIWNDAFKEMIESGASVGGGTDKVNDFFWADDAADIKTNYGQPTINQSLLDKFGPGGSEFGKRNADAYKTFNTSRAQSRLEDTFGPISDFDAYKAALEGLTGAVQSSFGAWIDGSMSAGQAFKKFIADSLKASAVQLLGEAVKHSVFAIGSLAFGDVRGAAQHGIAAAKATAGAAVLGVMAKSLGGSGGGGAGAGAGAAPTGSASTGGGGGRSTQVVVFGQDYTEESARQRSLRAAKVLEQARQATGNGGVSYA